MLFVPLASGDSGVRAIASITTSGSTGTAGAYGLTLFKPLAAFHSPGAGGGEVIWDAVLSSGGQGPVTVEDDACLMAILFPASATIGASYLGLEFLDV